MNTATYPIAPAVTPIKGTLLDAATVTDNFQWLDGHDLFESYNCLSFGQAANYCGPNVKDLSANAGWQNGVRFAAYGGVTCKAVGLDKAHMQAEVERVFNAGEHRAVERALMELRFVPDEAGETLWADVENITPAAGAVDPRVGVALLEGFAAANYVGTPTLHLPRTIASILTAYNALDYDGDMLRTPLGSKVAAGGGYDIPNMGPDVAPAPAGEKWLYASGEVLVGRGEAIIHQAIDLGNNDVSVLAERGYILAVDCFTAAIRVKVQ